MGNAAVKVVSVKREELSVVCIEMVFQGKGGDKSTKKSGVHDEE